MSWKIPYIDFGRQFKKLQREHVSNFKKIMTKGNFVLREDVARFEKNVAKLLKVKYVVGVNSCTDALLLSLGSFDFKKDSEIITVAHTYVATLAAIKHIGAKPILADGKTTPIILRGLLLPLFFLSFIFFIKKGTFI